MHFPKLRAPQSSMLGIGAVVTVFFWCSSVYFVKSYDAMQGAHSWISAHTILSVNNWLKESPQKFHFVSYFEPDSIEKDGNLAKRSPYISYPSGQIFFVYLFAKPYTMLRGRDTIGIKFLRHLQMAFFWAEAVMLALFVYRFASRARLYKEREKIALSILTALFWAWMPINAYYLANIYFSDQCVILFVMAFLLLEYESLCCTKQRTRCALNILKACVIYAGAITDYYLWIMVFLAFVLHIVQDILKKQALSIIAKNAAWYVVPILLAILTFLGQIMSVPGWKGILLHKVLIRTGIEPSSYNTPSYIIPRLIGNFKAGTGIQFRKSIMLLVILGCVMTLWCGTSVFSLFGKRSRGKRHSITSIILDNNCTIIITGMLSPLLQIALLSNHSAIHEFSMIKLAWCIAMLPIVLPLMYRQKEESIAEKREPDEARTSQLARKNVICFAMAMLICGIPFSSIEYINSRYYGSGEGTKDLPLAEILRNNTSYENVCFSFSKEIPVMPPQLLAVSYKRVYKITALEETESLFPKLPTEAVKILIIDKKDRSLPMELAENLSVLIEKNEHIYEDESFCLLKLDTPPR